jgi:hypothetical protein
MKHVDLDSNTILAIFGLAVLAVGLALFSVPLALVIVGGLVLIYSVIPDQTPGGPTP